MSGECEKNLFDEVDLYPKNVRQIGDIQSDHRTYIEDYVYTYIHQFAAQKKEEEQIAFLVGSEKVVGDDKILLINGAILTSVLKSDNEITEITKEVLDAAESTRKQYFKEFKIVGWAFSQPGYSVILTSLLIKQHYQYFKEEGQVLFVLDPIDKVEVFFQTENGILIEKTGFLIYYEKNQLMQEYMMDFKVNEYEGENRYEDVVLQLREREKVKKDDEYQKRFVNLLLVLSGALLVMCLLIGLGLLNNMEDVNELRNSIKVLESPMNIESVQLNKLGQVEEDPDLKTIADADLQTTTNPEEVNGATDPTKTAAPEVITTKPETTAVEPAVETIIPAEPVVPVGPANDVTNEPQKYTVKQGDSLIKISYLFYQTNDKVKEIQQLNGIDNPHKIYVGQIIQIP